MCIPYTCIPYASQAWAPEELQTRSFLEGGSSRLISDEQSGRVATASARRHAHGHGHGHHVHPISCIPHCISYMVCIVHMSASYILHSRETVPPTSCTLLLHQRRAPHASHLTSHISLASHTSVTPHASHLASHLHLTSHISHLTCISHLIYTPSHPSHISHLTQAVSR